MAALDPDRDGASPPLGRRARKALATRTAMFEAGLAAFENRPLAVVSVLDITEASDVAKGVFYLHFRSKDEYLIALWEFVQASLLEAIQRRLDAAGSARARLQAAVEHYHDMLADAPRECRFWLRMSSYFGDEIGEPGQMEELRGEYVRSLAALLGRVAPDEVGERDFELATAVDGACWGLISQAIQAGHGALERERFVRAVLGAARALSR